MTKQFFFKTMLIATALFLACSNNATAQTKLSILYKEGKIKSNLDDYKKPNNPVKWSGKFSIDEFTISDSITYYETVETYDEKDEYTVKSIRKARKNKPVGKAFIPHSSYCNYAAGFNLEEVEWKEDNYLVKTPIANQQKNWMFTEETKIIFGYNCKQAMLMNDAETEMVVWYTNALKCNYSINGDTSLPGTILETYIPKTNTLATIIDLQIDVNPILIPSKGAILVTQEEFIKLKKNKKS